MASNAVSALIKDVGRREVARRMNVSSAATYKWEKRVRAERAIELEEEFGVPRWKIRPDLWAEPANESE